MARFALVALCVTAALSGARAATPFQFGMDMSNRAYKAVCWFENLKVFPNTNTKGFNKCANGIDYIVKEFNEPNPTNKKYFERYPERVEPRFGERVQTAMDKLPSEYSDSCNQYLKDSKAAPPADESESIRDGGNDYPYKAYVYCLMNTLRTKHGDGAIESVKNERTVQKKHWMTALLERENEFRARHGAEPLELSQDLMDAAQGWAETNAKECSMYHSEGDSRKWNGESTGESLSAGMGDENDIAAYQAADGWYEEIKDYPYSSGGYTSENPDLFAKIGHFTQSVWKGSKYVGYGYAYSKDCEDQGTYSRYVAARYFPAGNMMGEYPKNVNPPKN